MKLSEKDLFTVMRSGKKVKIEDINGHIYIDKCWAYNSVDGEMQYDRNEPYIETMGTILFLSEIKSIEYLTDASQV